MTSRPYLPTDDPGQLLFWGDVRVAANVTKDSSGNVSALATRGGIIPSVTASSGYPVLNAGALNGSDALSFPARGLDAAIATALAANMPVNIYFVGNLPASQSGYGRSGALQQSENGNDAYGGLSLISTGTDTSTVTGYNLFNGPMTQVSANTTHVFSAYTLDGTTSNIAIDGQGVVNNSQKPYYTSPLAGFSLGWSGSDGPFPGMLGEYIVIIGTMTQDRDDKMRGYLAWSWGNQSKLAANDPYANAAPTVASNSDTTASGGIAPAASSAPIGSSGGSASATGALPVIAATAPSASAQGQASGVGSIAPASVTTPQGSVSGSAFASGAIAAATALAMAAVVSGSALISGPIPQAAASAPTAAATADCAAQGSSPPATSNAPAASVGANASAAGAIATVTALPMAATVAGDGGAYGAPPGATAAPLAANATSQASGSAAGALPLLYASTPTAIAGASASASGSIASAQSVTLAAVAGGSAVVGIGVPTATASALAALVGGDGGATAGAAGTVASPPSASVSIVMPGRATGSPPIVWSIAPTASVSAPSSVLGAIAGDNAQPLAAMVGAHSVAAGAIEGSIATPPQARATAAVTFGAVEQRWAISAIPRRFTGQATRRIFAIAIGGPYKMNFPFKYSAEIRNASLDFAQALAIGENLTGTPAVLVIEGDISVVNVALDGTVVRFTIGGGTVGRFPFQLIGVSCETTVGQVLAETITLAIR